MPRNLNQRVEAVAPVEDHDLQARLQEILDVARDDDTLAWQLDAEGVWHKVPSVEGVNSQVRLQELALERARLRRDTRAGPLLEPRR